MKQILILSCIMLMTCMYTNGQEKRRICSYCNGTGVVECNKCRGKGYLVYSFGPDGTARDQSEHNMTCPQCNRSGKTVCPLKDEYPQLHPSDSQQKKSYREQYNDGSYADVTENADGTTTHVTHRKCYSCKGYGKCSICNGMGGLVVGVYTKQWRGCTLCGGSGKCKYCNGTGENVMVQTYYPSTKTAVGLDIYTGKTYQSTYGERHERNESSSRTSTSSSSKCSTCNGTGIDPARFDLTFLLSNGLVVGYYNKAGTKCPYCKEYSGHKHIYCPKCQADKHAIH